MTNKTIARRASSLGSVHGHLARFAKEHAAYQRLSEDRTEVRLYGSFISTLTGQAQQDALRAYEEAWMTAWERGQVELGRVDYHLTAPAARAHA